MGNATRTVLGISGALVALSRAGQARADDPPAAGGAAGATVGTGGAQVHAAGGAGGGGAATKKGEEDTTPDHEKVIKKLAVGYFGVSQIPLAGVGGTGAGTGLTRNNVTAPAVGIRYWFADRMGADVGIGLGMQGGSTETVTGTTTTTTDKATAFGFLLHGGFLYVPSYGRHYKFLINPFLNFGRATQTVKPGAGAPANTPDTELSGIKFDLGGRVGAEVQFGFIGLPELSLQATIGLAFRREATRLVQGQNSASDGTSRFATTVESTPWALFTNNISAFYYFP